jgi:hypothetical protein
MEFIKKNIIWIVGGLIVAIVIYLICKKSKDNSKIVKRNIPISDGSGDTNIIVDMPLPDPDPIDDNSIGTGLNILPNEILPDYQVSNNAIGFNAYDGTAPRYMSVPLQARKEQIYIEPFNQGGGMIREY